IPCIICLYLTNRKLRTVTLLSGVSAAASFARAHAFVLPSTSPRTTIPTFDWLGELQAIRKFDAFFMTYAFIITMIVIVLIIAVKRLCRRKSFVYIEIRAEADKMMQFRLFAFPNPTRNYRMRASTAKLQLHSYYLFGILSFTTKAWKITDNWTNEITILPTHVFIPFWKMHAVRDILAAPHCEAVPLLVYSHEYDYRAVKPQPPPYPPIELTAPSAPPVQYFPSSPVELEYFTDEHFV
ncbi:MAG TPA: hypothetical protein VLS45_08065, partial [Methylomicrobium sp.]|nr:hypothetical protein [Methylomicrobium sp.]